MKKLVLVILLFFGSFSVISQNTKADFGSAGIGLVVSDIEASERFYTEVVGLVQAGRFHIDENWSKEAGTANNKPFSVKIFKTVKAESATRLKLAYFDSVEPKPEQTGIDAHAGVNYITFHFNDFNAVIERIKKHNIKIEGWVKRDKYQLVFIKDPDGVFVELVGPPEE